MATSKTINLDAAKKDELRSLCKKHGVTGYGKLSNDGMRAALRALIETDPHYQTTGPKKDAEPVVTTPAQAERIEKNGVRRPKDGGLCAAVWSDLDKLLASGTEPTTAQVRDLAVARSWNINNATAELSAWRKFNGIARSVLKAPAKAKRKTSAAKLAPPAARIDGSVEQYVA